MRTGNPFEEGAQPEGRPGRGGRGEHGHRGRGPRAEFRQAFGGFGPPPGGPGFGPGAFGPGFGPFRGGGPGGRGGRHGGRARRGDVRASLLALLKDRPMHGYEMIREIRSEERV